VSRQIRSLSREGRDRGLQFVDGLVENRSQVVIEALAAIGPVSFSMAWHPRPDNDTAHCWLRETILATTNQNS
jgi:hypothetical protein